MAAKFQKKDDYQPKEPKQQCCQAHGCPLMGTRSSGRASENHDEHRWWCRFHYGQELSSFGRITDRIIRSKPMIQHIARLKNAIANEITENRPHLFVYTNNMEFSRQEGEDFGDYVTRLEYALKTAILQGIEHTKLEDAKELVAGFTDSVSVTPKSWDEKTSLLQAEAKRMKEAQNG